METERSAEWDKQQRIIIEKETSAVGHDSQIRRILTPFAQKHYKLVNSARMFINTCIKDDRLLVFETWSALTPHRKHITNWVTRECSDCYLYSEKGMACVHMAAIMRDFGPLGDTLAHRVDGNLKLIANHDIDAMIKHTYAPCYWMSTMKETFDNASVAIAACHEWAHPKPSEIVLYKSNYKGRGRPETKRLSSRMDGYKTGSNRSKKKATIVAPVAQTVLRLKTRKSTSGGSGESDEEYHDENVNDANQQHQEEEETPEDDDEDELQGEEFGEDYEPEYDSECDYDVKDTKSFWKFKENINSEAMNHDV